MRQKQGSSAKWMLHIIEAASQPRRLSRLHWTTVRILWDGTARLRKKPHWMPLFFKRVFLRIHVVPPLAWLFQPACHCVFVQCCRLLTPPVPRMTSYTRRQCNNSPITLSLLCYYTVKNLLFYQFDCMNILKHKKDTKMKNTPFFISVLYCTTRLVIQLSTCNIMWIPKSACAKHNRINIELNKAS